MDHLPDFRIEKLRDGASTNWLTWKHDIASTLTVMKANSHLTTIVKVEETGYAAWSEKDAVVRYLINSSLMSNVKLHILTCQTAKDMWDTLTAIFDQKNERKLDMLYCSLFQYRKDPNDSIAIHASKLSKLFADLNEELKAEKTFMPPSLLMNRILNTLPEQFFDFHNAWESVPKQERTVNFLVERLRLHEQRLLVTHVDQVPGTAFMTKSKNSHFKKGNVPRCSHCKRLGHTEQNCWSKSKNNASNSSNSGANQNNPLYCNICKKKGHTDATCWHKDKSNEKRNMAFCAYEASDIPLNTADLYLDSGAAMHICNNKNFFSDMRPAKRIIKVANNETLTSASKGTLHITLQNLNHASFADVCYAPQLGVNLLSVSKIVEKGNFLIFTPDGCAVYPVDECSIHGTPVLTGTKKNGLFKLDVKQIGANFVSNDSMVPAKKKDSATYSDSAHSDQVGANATTLQVNPINEHKSVKRKQQHGNIYDQNIWHRRLGHLNHFCMAQLKAKNSDINYAKGNFEICESCVMGKMARKPFPKSNFVFQRSKAILDLIHTDLCSFEHESISGAKYFLSFIDDYSRKGFVYFLKKKSDVFPMFQKFHKFVETQQNKKIKEIMSDNGGEYCSKDFESYLSQHGIRHTKTVPYTPQQNGIAERYNRTIVEKARAMMNDANLGPKLWGEAVNTAVYLTNRSPTKSKNNQIPQELWTGRRVTLKHLRIFGCTAYTRIHKRQKLDDKAKKCIFLGYNKNCYRLLDLTDETTLILGRDVTFNEKEFPGTNGHCDTDSREETQATIRIPRFQQNSQRQNEPRDQQDVTQEPITEEAQDIEDPWSTLTNTQLTGQSDHSIDQFHSFLDDEELEPRAPLPREAKANVNYEEFFNVMDLDENIPKNVQEAQNSVYAKQWQQAINDELQSIKRNKTWTLVDPPANIKPINSKWVFSIKNSQNGPIYKARLVAKGFTEIEGIHYSETFSPVIRYSSFRLLLAFAVENQMTLTQLDIKTAFLNAELDEEIYLIPKDVNTNGKVCRLNKALYGLKQSSRCWYKKMQDTLVSFGFETNSLEPCIFQKLTKKGMVIVALWVDDILLLSNDSEACADVKQKLCKTFETKDLGTPKTFLGLNISYTNDCITLGASDFINKLIAKYGLENANPSQLPMEPKLQLDNKDEEFDGPYQALIGSLLYLSTTCRPDITYPVTYLSQFNVRPTVTAWKSAKRILRYLLGTQNNSIYYRKCQTNLFGFSDAAYANNFDMKSFGGYIFLFAGGAISWSTRKQAIVCTSSTESEYVALSEAAKEAAFLSGVLGTLLEQPEREAVTILSDSQSAIALAENPIISNKSKHIKIKYHYIREKVDDGSIVLSYVPTGEMGADFLTKAVPFSQFFECKSIVGLE